MFTFFKVPHFCNETFVHGKKKNVSTFLKSCLFLKREKILNNNNNNKSKEWKFLHQKVQLSIDVDDIISKQDILKNN